MYKASFTSFWMLFLFFGQSDLKTLLFFWKTPFYLFKKFFDICQYIFTFCSALIPACTIRLATIHIWRPWKLSNFQNPLLPFHLRPKLSHSPWPWTSNFKRIPTSPHSYPLQQTMEKQPHRACKRKKSKQKQNQVTSQSNWPRILSFDLAHKQFNGIIKGWLHCLTSESIGKVLVNNTLIFDSAWYLVMAQIQFSLIKKNKNWISRTLVTTPSPPLVTTPFHSHKSDNISFLPYPPSPPQSGRHICVTPYQICS